MRHSLQANQDNLKRALLCILVAVFSLSLGDAVIKLSSVSLPMWQLFVIRSMFALPILLALIKFTESGSSLIPVHFGWTLLRSLLLVAMWIAYYAALPQVQLSVAAAIYYTIPLFITLFSAWFTDNTITGKSWSAIIIGFAGVLVIVRPTADELNAYIFLPLLAAILYALAMILTRTKCKAESPKVLALNLMLTFILVGLIATLILFAIGPSEQAIQYNAFLFSGWKILDQQDWFILGLLGVIVVIGSWFSAIAYQSAPSQIIAAFDYSYLIFSLFWGWAFFTEVPDLPSIIGMIMIVAAGLTILKQK